MENWRLFTCLQAVIYPRPGQAMLPEINVFPTMPSCHLIATVALLLPPPRRLYVTWRLFICPLVGLLAALHKKLPEIWLKFSENIKLGPA